MGRRAVTSAQDLTSSALRVIERDGLIGVSSRAVAAEAGIALGTVYRHVPDLQNLLDAAAAQVHALFVDRMAAAAPQGQPLLPALPEVARAIVNVARGEPRLSELLALPVRWQEGGGAASIREWIAVRVSRAIADQEIPPTDPPMVAAAAYGLVAGVLQFAISTGSDWASVELLLTSGLVGVLAAGAVGSSNA